MPPAASSSRVPYSQRLAALALAGWRGKLWLWPLVASLLLVLGVMVWAYRVDESERMERRATMIADALSSEGRLRDRMEAEQLELLALAQALGMQQPSAETLARQPQVTSGLQRLWMSVTWLDLDQRIVADVPAQAPGQGPVVGNNPEATGVSAHLMQKMGQGVLVVRYNPQVLLQHTTPWWVARKYDVQLIDDNEQVIASLDTVPLRTDAAEHENYMLKADANLPGAYLELTARQINRPFWRNWLAVLMVGFMLLMVSATVLLKRQVRRISDAEYEGRTEAAWRRAMEDSVLVGLRARDMEGRTLYVNRTFCEMVGMDEAQLIGCAPPMPYWPADSIDEAMLRHLRNLQGKAPREGYEVQWQRSDGRRIDVMVFESPLVDARGQQLGWMGSTIDITARVRLQERERQQAQVLAHQSRLTTLGEVASALAHQLNQPLTVLMGYNAGLLRLLTQQNLPLEMLRHALQQQGEQITRLGQVVAHIRDFLTRRTPQLEACDLRQVCERAVALLARECAAQQIAVQWDCQKPLPQVAADAVLMEQVLINLLRNAMDALRDQHAHLDAAAAALLRIELAQDDTAQAVVLAIHDNGPGLQGRSLQDLCEPFYTTKTDGMGMGLSICRSIVEAHHGHLSAGDSPLGGACMRIALPTDNEIRP